MTMSSRDPHHLAQLIRRFRLTAGLSQEELAGRSGVNVRAISDLERGVRTLPRLESLRMLAGGLELTDDQRAELIAAARPELRDATGQSDRQSVDSPYRKRVPDHVLPLPGTSLIGREQELSDLVTSIMDGESCLITLTGPGGVGKTRLALQVAENVKSLGVHQVVFIPLASITDPELVAPTIGRFFDLSGSDAEALPDRLSIALSGQHLLLVLDNFELLLPAAPLVASLLLACPSLQVLVTSRVFLRLSVECEFPVTPLELPQPAAISDQNDQTPAVRLFFERSALNALDLAAEESSAVAGICRRVDGLPLAIELAAAKTRLLTPSELLQRMNHALPLLVDGPRDAPARLQTMRNAIAWSFDLLSDNEKTLFCALSVFSGGFTISDAEAVAPPDPELDTLAALESLLDHSLIRRIDSPAGPQRFTMLETIREYGHEQLVASGTERSANDNHAAWFISRLTWPDPENWSDMIVPSFLFPGEQDNLRTALRWSLAQGEVSNAANLALGLLPFWWREGYFTEGRGALTRILEKSGLLSPALRAAITGIAADFAFFQSDFETARRLATEGLGIARKTGTDRGICRHLRQLGWAAIAIDPPSAVAPFEELLALRYELDDKAEIARSLFALALAMASLNQLSQAKQYATEAHKLVNSMEIANLSLRAQSAHLRGDIALYSGEYDVAEPLLIEALKLRQELGNKYFELHCRRDLGRVALERGDLMTAARLYTSALELAHLLGSEHGKHLCFVEIAAVSDDAEASARLLGAEYALRRRGKFSDFPSERELRDRTTQTTRLALGDARFSTAFETGTTLSSKEAYTLAKIAASSTVDQPQYSDSLLTLREREVLILISEGKSDREIGDALFVSRRTAATHVRNVLGKLDVHSRAEAAAWAVRQGIA